MLTFYLGSLKGRRLGRPRRRWEDNIKMNLGEGLNSIRLAQNGFQWWAFVNTVMNLQF
jgi:hypothetical protein